MKPQTPSTKLGPHPAGGDSEGEITNKSQIPILNDQNKKQVWSAGGGLVIAICLIFVICDLEFLILQYSKTACHLYQRSHWTLT